MHLLLETSGNCVSANQGTKSTKKEMGSNKKDRGDKNPQDCGIGQGSPTPGPWTSTSPWPVRNQATQQEVSSG